VSFLSFDNERGGFDLPTEQREFNRKLRLLEVEGYKITGRQRTVAENRRLTGMEFSQHLIGLAGDIRSKSMTPEQVQRLMARARSLGLTAVGPAAEVKMGHPPHVHVQAYPRGVIPRQVYQQIGVQIQETP